MLGCALPIRCAHDAGGRERGALVDERRQQRGEQVDLDQLSLAGCVAVAQRREDADGREQPRQDVHERDADLLRLAAGLAGDAHQTAERLHQQVVAGQLRAAGGSAAEAGDRAVDQRWVLDPQRARSRGRARRAAPGGSSRPARPRSAPARAPAPDRRGRARSSTTLRLLRLTASKYVAWPWSSYGGPHVRVSSPIPGRSILVTSAPRSASIIVANGPARTREKSRMRR